MNEKLTGRIKQYLELDTNYAIIINGDYGIGKTYYMKNELFPIIEKIKIPNIDNEFYNPILISLFGVNSIEEIQNQIFFELYPILKRKGVKIATGLFKSALRIVSGTELKDVFNDMGTKTSDFNNFSKILLCFDDIDRKSESLNLKEVFGFINNLVENFQAKVILIANEDELRKEFDTEKDNYSVLREKVIGISLNFNAEVSLIYDQIIFSKYSKCNEEYFDFLTENKSIIVKRIEQNKDNLRNLVFFFEHFKIIYIELISYLDANSEFDDVRKDLILSILNFALPLSIEYKLGKLNNQNSIDIEKLYKGLSFSFLDRYSDSKSTDITSQKTYSDEFNEKYFDETKRKFFASIFDYILGISYFDNTRLINEINSFYNIEDSKIPEREQLLLKLGYWDFLDMGFKEYKISTNKMLKYVDKGQYSLNQYPTIFHFATRFKNVLNYDIDKLLIRFKKGIDRGNYSFESNLSFQISMKPDTEYYESLKELFQFCEEVNEKAHKEFELKKAELLFQLFKANFDDFIIQLKDNNNEFKFKPFFSLFEFKLFWRVINNMNNRQIIELAYFFNSRYRKHVYEGLNKDKNFLVELNEYLLLYLRKKNKSKLDKISFEFLKEKVENSINNFNM